MKILVISLLRLGDFIQILPVLQGLRTQTNVRQLDVLTHQPVRALAPMVRDVHKWWTLDRDQLQEGLGRAEIPLLTSFSVLKEKLDEINAEKYDCIINLTQTYYSAWIAGYLQARNRTGLAFDQKGQAHFHSPWFQYLDDHAPLEVRDVFHYTDIFYYGSGLKGGDRIWNLRETDQGRAEFHKLSLGAGEKIVLQTLTSDAKKNWSDKSWLEMIRELQLFRPNARFVLLGAPSEEAKLDAMISAALAQKLKVSKAILSLEGAHSLLKNSQLLITGDTSIKHLANAVKIPTLELSLGSSDLRRTGSYKADSLILQPSVECAPCPHSSPCRKSTHECAIQLTAELVSASAHNLLEGNWPALRELANEYRSEVHLFRTRALASGFWMACDLAEKSNEKIVETLIDRCTWKFLLNREYVNPLAQFGSEGVYIKRELEEIAPSHGLEINRHLDFLESQAGAVGDQASALLTTVKRRNPAIEDIGNFISRIQPQSNSLTWLEKLKTEKTDVITEIGGLRRVHNQLDHFLQQAQVKMKLIRSLKSQLMEPK